MDPYSMQVLIMNQFNQMTSLFIDHIGDLLIASVYVVVGLFAAEVSKHLGSAVLGLLRWNKFCQWSGMTLVLQKYRADIIPSKAAGEIVWWVVFFSFVMKALIATDMGAVVWIGRGYFDLLPVVVKGAVVLLASHWIARFTAAWITLTVEQNGAILAAGLARILVWSCGVYAALTVVGWEQKFVLPLILVLAGSAAVSIAIQWTMGSRQGGRQVIRVRVSEEAASKQ